MNFDDAISAHIKWKVRLARFIDGTSADLLKSEILCRDNLCDLGKWIYGEGAVFNDKPHYQDVVTKHANFHRCAANVVKKVEDNDNIGANSLLSGQFTVASKETVTAIMELKKETR
jgi:hypothetical protein